MLMFKILHALGAEPGRGVNPTYRRSALPADLSYVATATAGDLFHRYRTGNHGLNREAVLLSREDHGRNVLTAAQEASVRKHLGRILPALQSVLRGTAATYLKRLVDAPATVTRVAGTSVLAGRNLVAGDIVELAAGDMVPADLRIISAESFSVNEAALAGASTVCEKHAERMASAPVAADAQNLAFAGTVVRSGSARGVVIAVGENTLLAQMTCSKGPAAPSFAVA